MASKIKVDTLETADGTGSITLSNQFSGMTTASLPSSVVTEDASGNVGIGVTPKTWYSNATALQISPTAALYNTSNWEDFSVADNAYYNSSGVESYIQNDAACKIRLTDVGMMDFRVTTAGNAGNAISWTTAMAIDNSGQIRVGNLQDSLQPAQGISCSGNGYASLRVRRGSDSGDCMAFYGSSSTSSNVGSIYVTASSTSYNTSSDYRLKENVIPMSGSIDRLKELKPSRFNFIADADTTVDGFLAHEAQAVVPEAISGEKDAMKMEEYEVTPEVKDDDGNVTSEAVMGERSVPDMQGIDQSKLVPLLTSALQDAIAKIEQLESRISALEVN